MIERLLSELRQQGVRIRSDGDQVHCDAPPNVMTPELVDQLREHKAQIIEFLSKETVGANVKDFEGIPVVSRTKLIPLSFAQESLWFLDQLKSDTASYNIPIKLQLPGVVDEEILRRSLTEIVRRHEILRTCVRTVAGRPIQAISPATTFSIPVVDLTDLPKESREEEAHRQCEEHAKRPFALDRDWMLRVVLFRLERDRHILLLNLHHIASDAWSLEILLHELRTLYEAYSKGQPSPFEELPVQYADFAVWQRERLTADVYARQLKYWKRQLDDAPPVLELPTEWPRPPVQTFRGAVETIWISGDLATALKALSQHEGVSLFMTLLAAFQVLLYRYSGQQDIVVGSPIVNRSRTGLESLIGLFVNTLPLRVDLSGNPTFRELLLRAKEVVLGAYDNQDIPFEALVKDLHPERNLSYSPVFQVLFALQNAVAKPGNLKTQSEFVSSATSKFDLSLYMRENAYGMAAEIEYCTDLFGRQMIRQMSDHLVVLLTGIVENPHERINTLPLLTAVEKERLLATSQQTRRDYGRERCLDELIEEQIRANPDRCAVRFGEDLLTYKELGERADKVARRLRSHGIGPNDLVGLCIDRSIDMVIGLVGILKAGGAYLPLDPLYPPDRLKFMLEDAGPKAVLTQKALVGTLPSVKAQFIFLDDLWQLNSDDGSDSVRTAARRSDDLAYVIYTSGSTGTPKGVQITHRSIVNFLKSMRDKPGLRADDTLLAVTTLSFDIAALELFLPLTVGALVVVASFEAAADASQLMALMKRPQVTMMQATPATWHLLIQAGWSGRSGLKILCGGESWSSELAEQLLSRCDSVWNMYGPTETTVWSSAHEIRRDERVLIGPPIANTSFYVLQSDLQLAPSLVPGELHIGGAGVARGYLNRPELTNEKFVANPFNGDRLYKTGDLVRCLPDGALEFLGRTDTQVKVRGFRIELDEIASALRRHGSVEDAVVLVQKHGQFDDRLVAYIVVANDQKSDSGELQAFLKRQLPSYMVPSAFEIVERFPLTPAGKIDRKALQKIPARQKVTKLHVPPRTTTERVLAEIWREILGVDSVGAQDDFFDLGGHSMMIVQLIYRVNAARNVRLGVPDLFRNPTVEQLAAVIDSQQAKGPRQPAVIPLQEGGSEIPLYFIYAGPDEFHLARLMGTRRPVFGIEVPWPVKWRKAVESNQPSSFPDMEQLVAPFAEVLFAHVGTSPCMLAGHSFAGLIAVEAARQLQKLGGKVETVIVVDKWSRYPPPFQVAWENLRQCWKDAPIDPRHDLARSVIKRCRRSMYIVWWLLRSIGSAILALLRNSPGNLTTTTDEEGTPLPWGLLARLYTNIEKTYYPEPLDCRGIIFRTDFMDNYHSVRVLDENLGWGRIFKRGVSNFSLSGDHISIFRTQNESLASMINKVLQCSGITVLSLYELIPMLLESFAKRG
jgi:amino acid adenylation domain-containing protein